jgi:hypothetical protein
MELLARLAATEDEVPTTLPPSARGIGGAPPQRLWPGHVALVDRLWRRLSERGGRARRMESLSYGMAVLMARAPRSAAQSLLFFHFSGP